MCDLEEKRCLPHWVVILCPFPPFSICTCHCDVYWCSYVEGVLYSLPHVILIATYKLPNLEDEPAFSWKKKNHRSIAFFQDYNIWGRYIYLACINVCMSGVFFRDYIASWAHDIHPLLNYSIIMFLFKKISILFFFYYFIVIHHHCSWKRVI